VPPFTGSAVKVTLSPIQIVGELEERETDGVTEGVTNIVTVFELVAAALMHNSLEVNTAYTTSLFANDELVKVLELLPVFVPLIFHW
jgi:hypothetical protein